MPREKKKITPAPKKTVPTPEQAPAQPVKIPPLTDVPDAPLGYHIMAAARAYTHALGAALSAKPSTSKLTVPRLQAMQVIAANGGIIGSDIARAMNVKPQTVTTIVNSLTAQGWIERSPGKGRAFQTYLNAQGRAQLAKGLAVVAQVDEALALSFSHDGAEAKALTDLLRLGRQTFAPAA